MGVTEAAVMELLSGASAAEPAEGPANTPDEACPAVALSEEREIALLEAERFLALGHVELEQSRYTESRKCYETALDICRTHANRAGEGQALGLLGNIYQTLGQYDQAIAHYTQSIAIAREVGDWRYEGIHLGNLGNVYKAQGQYDEAIEHYTASLASAREIGDKRHEGINIGNIGGVYQAQGQVDEAIAHYTQSIAIAREVGNKRGEGIQLGNLGDALVKLERAGEAEAVFREAIVIGDETCPGAAGAFRGSLALLLAQKGKHDEARALLDAGAPQVESDPEDLAKFLCKEGQACLAAGDAKGARSALVQAQGVAVELRVSDDSEVAQEVAELVRVLRDWEGRAQ
jgi:tetratricopeptide (TPR) repeat protein